MGRPIKRTDTDAGWINRRFKDLERQIRELRAAKGLEASTIGSGGLTIKDGGGVRIEEGGGMRLVAPDGKTTLAVISSKDTPDPDGNPQPMVLMRRADGTLAMSLDDPLPNVDGYRQIFRLWDRSGNEIFAEDATSGKGIANPWLPFAMYPTRYSDWPKSTSGSFESIWRGAVAIKNPRITLGASYTSDDPATTGEVRFRISDLAVGTTQSFGFGIGTTLLANKAALPSGVDINNFVMVSLEIRRTAGTGNVMAAPYVATGAQSP